MKSSIILLLYGFFVLKIKLTAWVSILLDTGGSLNVFHGKFRRQQVKVTSTICHVLLWPATALNTKRDPLDSTVLNSCPHFRISSTDSKRLNHLAVPQKSTLLRLLSTDSKVKTSLFGSLLLNSNYRKVQFSSAYIRVVKLSKGIHLETTCK